MLAAVLGAFALIVGASADLSKLSQVVLALFSASSSSNSSESAQLDQIQQSLAAESAQITKYCTEIAAQIETLDQEVFANTMSGILGNVDASAVALAEWHQNQDATPPTEALDSSLLALSTISEEYANGAYPGSSMLMVLARAILARLGVLATFSDVPTPTDTAQLQNALTLLQSNTGAFDEQLVNENEVHTTYTTQWLPVPPPVPPHSPHLREQFTAHI